MFIGWQVLLRTSRLGAEARLQRCRWNDCQENVGRQQAMHKIYKGRQQGQWLSKDAAILSRNTTR
jgi:hypothetical protein